MNNAITVMSYDQWEQLHRQHQRSTMLRKRQQMKRLKRYYLKQKIFGFMIILFGLLVCLCGSAMNERDFFGLGAVFMLSGLYVAITRTRLIYDNDVVK